MWKYNIISGGVETSCVHFAALFTASAMVVSVVDISAFEVFVAVANVAQLESKTI